MGEKKIDRTAGTATAIGAGATPVGLAAAQLTQELLLTNLSQGGVFALAVLFSTVIAFVVGYLLKPTGERDTQYVESVTLQAPPEQLVEPEKNPNPIADVEVASEAPVAAEQDYTAKHAEPEAGEVTEPQAVESSNERGSLETLSRA